MRHDAYHRTADDAAVTSSRLAVRTVRVIIGEKFLDLGGGRNSKKGSVTLRSSGSPIIIRCKSGGDQGNVTIYIPWRSSIQKWRENKLLLWATLCVNLTVATF